MADIGTDLSDEMLAAITGIINKLPSIFAEIAKSETIVKTIAKVVSGVASDTKDSIHEVDKTSSKIAKTATSVYRNFQIDKLVSGAERIGDVFMSSAKTLQKTTTATFSEWSNFYTTVVKSTKELNRAIAQAGMNSADILEAANKLASIGFKGLNDSLTQASTAIALINKSVGTTTTNFNRSVISMQKVFKDGTANLIEGLGDSLTAYNSVFGVTTEKLQDASAFLSASLTKISKGNAAVMKAVTQDLFKAVSIAESMGIDSQAISNVMFDAMNMSYGKFASQYAGSLSAIGINAQEFQKMVQSGDMSGATTQLVTSIQSRLGQMDTNQQNLWKEMLSGMGFDANTINAILNNTDNLTEILSSLDMLNDTEGAMKDAIGEHVLSLGERFQNALSGSAFLGALQNSLSALGIGSVKDATGVVSNVMYTVTGLKQSGMLDAIKGATKGGEGAGGLSKLLGPISKIFSGSLPAVLGKLALAAGIFLLVAKTVTRVIDKLKANDSFQQAIKMFKEAIGVILDIVMEIIDGIADVISEVIVKIVEVVTKIITALQPVFDLIKNVVHMILPLIKDIFDMIIRAIDTLIDPIIDVITTVVNVFTDLAYVITPIIETITKIVNTIIKLLLPIIQIVIKVVGAILKIISGVIGRVIGVISDVVQALGPLIEAIMDVIGTILDQVMGVLDELMPIIDIIFDALQPILEVIIEVISTLLSPLSQVLRMVVGIIGPLLKPLIEVIKVFAKVINFIAPVIKFISKIISAIVGGLQAVGNWLADISIFGWHPFEFLRSSNTPPDIPDVSETQNVNNSTSQATFNSTAAGGLTYGFGLTGNGFHVGTDIPMSSGTPLTAAQAGIVTASGFNGTYGNYASILGNDGIQRVFGHLSNLMVGRGDTVLPGQQIGASGNTGNSELPHLHYETRENGSFVDPYIIAQHGGNNADVVHAIEVMTNRLERKLDEVSEQTEDNSKWIENFEKEQRLKFKAGY